MLIFSKLWWRFGKTEASYSHLIQDLMATTLKVQTQDVIATPEVSPIIPQAKQAAKAALKINAASRGQNLRSTAIYLDVPYRSQRDNTLNPNGACNVTSLAMALLYFKVQPRYADRFPQFEDELYDYTERLGLNRHDALDLVKVVEAYGCRDRFSSTATLNDVRAALNQDQPVILHGYFTSFGHIIVAVGYDEHGLIVHDPYGEWHSWGYDLNDPEGNNTKGKFQHYSDRLIEQACMPDGNLWAHVISSS
ncbi:MAG: hypothetical protein RLZZ511_1546 [Cyanobacteriota bacterium]|jgi:uncharacterized protein YvpB